MSLIETFDYEYVEPTQDEKLKTWCDIKKHLPEFAEFMLELKTAFGKITNVEIKVKWKNEPTTSTTKPKEISLYCVWVKPRLKSPGWLL